jgi:hypothetical protein
MKRTLIVAFSMMLVFCLAIPQEGFTAKGDLLLFPQVPVLNMEGWWQGTYSGASSSVEFGLCSAVVDLHIGHMNGSFFWGDFDLTGCFESGKIHATFSGVENGSNVQMILVYDDNSTSSWEGEVAKGFGFRSMPRFYGIAKRVIGNQAISAVFDLKWKSRDTGGE